MDPENRPDADKAAQGREVLFAAVLASLCAPRRAFLERSFRGRRSLAALWVVLTVAVVIVLPLLLLFSALATEGVDSVSRLQG